MPSLSFIYVFVLLSTSLLALTIAPIPTVTQFHPFTVTWFRQADDPESWSLWKFDRGGDVPVSVPHPEEQAGEAVVSFTRTGRFELVAVVSGNAGYVVQIEVPSSSPDPTPTQITPTSLTAIPFFPSTLMSIPLTSSTVTVTSSSTSTDSSSISPLPSSLGGTSSILPFDSPSTGKSQKNTKIPAVVGGSVGAAGFFVLISVFLLCQRRGKRGVHTPNKGPWQTITPFQWSSHSIDQTLRISAGLDEPLGGGERNDSEVATTGRGHGELDSSSVSVGTARNVRIPVQRQFRTAGWILNKTKVSSEKRQSSDEQREVFDWTDHDNNERIRDLPTPTGRTFPPMQENDGGTPNTLRHLDSGIRIMHFYRPELARGQGMSQRDNGESRGHGSEVVEDTIGLPPEYSFV
ncbi:hypothetical protein K435DRAFT_853219 [Dendrothele bispora CBS 962.96]|uniref:Mid2 domain-containing protein n=1 Tax=Dendrothele bispora (strain CBS 962.96) TaxID=1314807 RepID=A0A4S8MH17_DENBC|nr:hypothetical protein K435DRAFT_853219 [Dendrothele bispora CBS 962.96]